MFRNARIRQELRDLGFTKVEIKGVMRRIASGDEAGTKAFWEDCYRAAERRKAEKLAKKPNWLDPASYLV